MNKLIESVWDLSGEVCSDLRHIEINKDGISKLSEEISQWLAKTEKSVPWPKPEGITLDSDIVLYELIANSVNYCYWFGDDTLRPGGAQSTKMCDLLTQSFQEMIKLRKTGQYHPQHEVRIIVDSFKSKLISERFPLLSHRIQHLNEISNTCFIGEMVENVPKDSSLLLNCIVQHLSGYSQDLFLKRAILLILQLNRRLGLYEEDIQEFPIAADYQIPKMLRFFGCIQYKEDLEKKILSRTLLPENCREEIEIRAVSVLACKMISDKCGCSSNDVDSFLWLNRKKCKDPFHLTVTSNY